MSKNKYENALERIKKNVEPADNWTDEDREHYSAVVKALEIMCLITANNPQEIEPWMEAVSDLRTAIALAAAETGEVHPMPCKIGDKVYNILYDDVTDEHIVDELTVTEVGINGIFVSACCFAADDYGDYLPYAELGEEWYLGKEDAYRERDRRDEVNERQR